MKLTPADSAEIDTAARKHDTKFADMLRIRRGAIPSPDGCPSKIADDTTAEIIADLWWLADASRRVLEAVAAGAVVTVADWPAELRAPWPRDRAADMLTAWRTGTLPIDQAGDAP